MVESYSNANGQRISDRTLRTRLCLGSAFLALTALATAEPALAACSTAAPANGATVNCSGADVTGVVADTSTGVTVNVLPDATIIPPSGPAIWLGGDAELNLGVRSITGNEAIASYAVLLGNGSTVTLDGAIRGRGGITGPTQISGSTGLAGADITINAGGEIVTNGTASNAAIDGRAGGNVYLVNGIIRATGTSGQGIRPGNGDMITLGATGSITTLSGDTSNPIDGSGKTGVTVVTQAGSLIELHGIGRGMQLGAGANVTVGGTIRSYGDATIANSSGGGGIDVGPGSTVRLSASGQIVTGNTLNLGNKGSGGFGISTFNTSGPSNSTVIVDGLIDTQLGQGIFGGVGDSITIGATGKITTRGSARGVFMNMFTSVGNDTVTFDIAGRIENLGTASALFIQASRATGETVETAARANVTVRAGGSLFSQNAIAYGQLDGAGTFPEVIDNLIVAGTIARGTAGTVIDLNDGADRITLLPTYAITGNINGGSDPAAAVEIDTFALDGATGTTATFDFGVNQILNFEAGEKNGAGSWTLLGAAGTGLNGNFAINAGTLIVDGTLASAGANVASGATLKGSGAFGGAVTVVNGGILAGQAGADFGFGSLILNDTSAINLALGVPSTSALFNITGALTLDGRLNVSNAGGFGLGSYRLFDYAGALTNNGLTIQSLPVGFNPGDWAIDTATGGQVSLIVAPGPGEQYWDGTNLSPGNVANGRGGTAIWNATSTNWTNQAGSINAPWAGGIAVFGPCPSNACVNGSGTSPSYTVTVDAAGVSAKGLRTLNVPVTLAGGTITLADDARIDVNQPTSSGSGTLNASNVIHVTGDLIKGGLGSFFSSGQTLVDGGLTVEQGVMMATDATAVLDVEGAITVGGTGTDAFPTRLLASGGAKMTSAGGSVGGATNTAGSIIIQRGGGWDAGVNAIDVGASGVGILRVYSSLITAISEIKASEIVLGRNAGGNGKLQIWGDAGNGIVTATTVRGGVGGGGVEFDNRNSTNYAFAPLMTGNLSTTFLSGVTTLRGINDYAGATLVNGGTLFLDGASLTNSAVTVQRGTLGGAGTIAGPVGFAATNTILQGSAGQVLNMGSLALGSGTAINVTLGPPSTSALFNVTGALTLDGLLNVADGGGFTYGAYRLFDHDGVLTDNGLTLQSLPAGFNPGDWTIDTAITGQVTLHVVQSGNEQYWDGTNMAPGGVADGRGGSGIWNAANTNWTNQAGTINAPWASQNAIFAAAGASTVTIEGARTITGMRFLTGGDYRFTPGTAGSLTIANGGAQITLEQQGADATNVRIAAPITGSGGLTKSGAGTLILSGANSYAGGTTISAGTLQIGDGGTTGSITGNVANDAALAFSRSDDTVFAGIVSGSGGVVKLGAGVLTLAGTNSYAGGTMINAGTVHISANASLGAASGILSFDSGILLTDTSFTTTRSTTLGTGGGTFGQASGTTLTNGGAIGGTGALTKSGAGTLILTGTSSHAGGTTITAGILQIGNGGTTGSITGNIANQGALLFNRSDDIGFGGIVSGTGSLTKAGAGTLTLAGANSYTGLTTVQAGTLLIDGSIAGALVADAGRVGGAGLIGGNATIGNSATLLGRAGAQLDFGSSLTLASGSNVDVTLGAPSGTALFDVTGNLTLDGALHVTAGTGFGLGTYRLFDYDGALTDNGLVITSAPAGYNPGDWGINTTTTGQVSLIVATGSGEQYWDGTNMVPGGVANGRGGSGIWNAANTNWTNQAGTINAPWASQKAVFAAAGTSTVTIDGARTVTGMRFLSGSDYRFIAGTAGSLTIDDITQVATEQQGADVTTVRIAAPITGAGGLSKSGGGALILSGTNSYAGGTTISAGTLQIGDGGPTGSIAGNVTNNAVLAFNRSDDNSFAGIVSGSGSLVKQGAGTLTLTGINSYAGGTSINAGTLRAGTDANLGAASGTLSLNGGTLLTDTSFTMVRATTLGAGGGTFSQANGTSLIQGGTIGGAGGLTKSGAGSLILTGANTYAGGATISAGTLRIGNGGTTGSIAGAVANQGTLVFDRSDDLAFAGAISGNGNLVKTGAGTLTLSGANSHAGGTSIDAGTLRVSADANLGATTGPLTINGATLSTDGSFATGRTITLANGSTLAQASGTSLIANGAIGGSGGLTKAGTGTLILAGANGYTGGTTISAGTLRVGAGGTTGSISGDVINQGALVFDRSDAVTFAGTISGAGSLTKAGAGTLTLTGASSHAGGTSVAAGTLQIGNGGTTGSITGNVSVANGSTLAFNRSDTIAFAGSFTGNGALVKQATGTLQFTGNSSAFAGSTSVASGALDLVGTLGGDVAAANGTRLSGTGSIGGTVNIASGGTLAGRSGTTLSMGGLSLADGAVIDVALGTPGNSGPFAVAGNLVLDGIVNITDAGGFGLGVYRLIDYGGTLTDNGLTVGQRPTMGDATIAVQTSQASQINLVVAAKTGPDFIQFWNGSTTSPTGTAVGGNGIWSPGPTTNWTNPNGTQSFAWIGGFAVFQGAAGTVTTESGVSTQGMQFAVDGYRLAGAPVTLAAPGMTVARIGDGSAAGVAYRATIDAVLTGTSGLEKQDLGTLILTGANSYAGGTHIAAGTLSIGNGGTTGSVTGNIANDGALVFNRSNAYDFTGIVSGGGTLTKLGAGTLRLGGTHSYTGATLVSAGTLTVDGSIAGSTVTVSTGATLAGSGTLGTTIVAGTIAPGNSPGTLTIAGNYTQLAGSIYAYEPGDLIRVTGTATIQGGRVQAANAAATRYRLGDRNAILTAAGGRSGAGYAGVDPANPLAQPFLTLGLTYDANSVYLQAVRNSVTFESAGATINQRAAARGVEGLAAASPLYVAMASVGDTATARAGFDTLSGEIHATVKGVLLDESRHLREAVANRLDQARAGGNGIWGQAIGAWGDADSDGNAASLDRSTAGLLLGVDTALGEHWRAGLTGGYSRSKLNVDARASSATVDSVQVGAFAGGRWGGTSLQFGAALAWHDIATRRASGFTGYADTTRGAYDARGLQVFARAGHAFDLGSATLEPFGTIAHARLKTDAFAEQGGTSALSAAKRTDSATWTTLGLRGSTPISSGAALYGSVAWRHALDGHLPSADLAFGSGTPFRVYGTPLDRDAAALDIGTRFTLGTTGSLAIGYAGTIGSATSDHGVRASVAFRF